MKVLVFLGSNVGNKEIFKRSTEELSNWIGNNSHTLLYGGNSKGLMGLLADRVIEIGSKVIGVMPKYLMESEIPHDNLDLFVEVETMQERKDYLRELSDICIALPGGPGTMEEITEAISLYRVKQHDSPCVFYNIDGYYDPMKKMYDDMVENGFMSNVEREDILFTDNLNEIEEFYNLKKGIV